MKRFQRALDRLHAGARSVPALHRLAIISRISLAPRRTYRGLLQAIVQRESSSRTGRHQLTVDAYAVQHPGEASRRTARSVMLHLASLRAVFEHRADPRAATWLLRRLAARPDQPGWMEPPTRRGILTVADVHAANGAREHVQLVERWERSAWDSWSEHHPAVRRFLEAAR